jgi:hypothetical protein
VDAFLKTFSGREAGLLASLDTQIQKLDVAVEQLAKENPQARLLMTQPGVAWWSLRWTRLSQKLSRRRLSNGRRGFLRRRLSSKERLRNL